MKNFKVLFFTLCGLLCFGVAQAQWTNSGVNLYTFDEVGIDVTNPLRQLHIKANTDRNIRLEEDGGGTEYIEFGVDNSGDLNIYRDNSVVGFSLLDANGNVGINTAAPAYRLDVQGTARITSRLELTATTDASGTGNTGVLEIANALRLDGNEIITNDNATLFLNHDNNGDLRIDNTTFMVDASTNRVGIRTTAPAYPLDVNGDMRVRGNDIYGSGSLRLRGAGGGFVEAKSNSASWGLVVREHNSSDYGNIEVTSAGLGLGYRTSGAHMIIGTTGNVGIGTTAPSAKLHVNGGNIQIGSYEEFSDAGFEMMGVNASVVPTRDCLDDLGSASNRWDDVYYCGSLVSSSDRNLKSNIKDMDYGLAEILEMRPVTYTYKDSKEKGTKLGLIAQELQPIVSEIVKSEDFVGDENGNKVKKANTHLGVDYVALIPVLIKGMQEQQAIIEEQQARIDQLEVLISDDATPAQEIETAPSEDFRINTQPTGKVFQNNPNPFKNTTVINYELPENMTQARIIITDLMGKQVANYNLAANQKTGQVTVQANGLTNGTYIYTLIVDGTLIASNKMIVAK